MKEDFLYFLWQYNKFPSDNLRTEDGRSITIIKNGYHNTHSGPDFNEARIKIDGIEWCGQVEMHIRSSDWDAHHHEKDAAYNNVVLHVVWEHDTEVKRLDGSLMPTLALSKLVDKDLLERYKLLKENIALVPCINQVKSIPEIKLLSMLDRCSTQRLERKALTILDELKKVNGDWEEVAYRLCLKYLGFKVNAVPMIELSKKLPYKILKKNAHQPLVVEALLFGQAGLLNNPIPDYAKKLKSEYKFYAHKYSLDEPVATHLWKFLRMRPANFPTLRIAQFATMAVNNPFLFDLFIHEGKYNEIECKLRLPLNKFWDEHYHFNKEVKKYSSVLGKQAVQLLTINVIAPLRAAYAIQIEDYSFMDAATELLQQLPAEKNKITRVFDDYPLNNPSAFDSQALIELFENYCSNKQCLNCDVGIAIIKK